MNRFIRETLLLATCLWMGPGRAEISRVDQLTKRVYSVIEEKTRVGNRARPVSDRYFLTAFAYQDEKNRPENSHTWATLIRVKPNGKKEYQTISWLPKTFGQKPEIKVFKGPASLVVPHANQVDSEPGANFSLEQTLEFASRGDKQVSMFGPYPIDKKLFMLGMDQFKKLNSGKIEYKADDRLTRKKENGQAMNCFHAVADLGGTYMPTPGFLGYKGWGLAATKTAVAHIKKQYSMSFLNPADVKDLNYLDLFPIKLQDEDEKAKAPPTFIRHK